MEPIVEFIAMGCFGHQKPKKIQETIRNLLKKGLSKTVKCNDATKISGYTRNRYNLWLRKPFISVQSCPETLPQCPCKSVAPPPVLQSKTVLELPESKQKPSLNVFSLLLNKLQG